MTDNADYPPDRCTAWEDCNHDGVCHDPSGCAAVGPNHPEGDDGAPSSTVQEEIKARLWTDSFGENLAVMIYEAMRFERKEETPDWTICGNSNAQQEARAVSARVIERFRHELRDLPEYDEAT